MVEKKKNSEQKMKAVREQIIENRIRKGASRDMYSEIYKPITQEIEGQKEELSGRLKALPQIKQQLETLGDEMKEIQTYQGLPQLFKEALPSIIGPTGELTEEQIEKTLEEYEKETGTKPKQFKMNLNKDIDLNLLGDEYNTPQEVFDLFHSKSNDPDKIMTKEELNDIIANVAIDIKSLTSKANGRSRKKTPSIVDELEIAEMRNKVKNLKSYRDVINDILKQEKYMGKGMKYSHNPYKISLDGEYGNLLIDRNKLYSQNKLVARDKNSGKVVMNIKIDNDFIDLIDKRYDNKKQHTFVSKAVFKDLTEKSGLPFNKKIYEIQKDYKR